MFSKQIGVGWRSRIKPPFRKKTNFEVVFTIAHLNSYFLTQNMQPKHENGCFEKSSIIYATNWTRRGRFHMIIQDDSHQ